ncbi:hypothetical protein Tco_1046429, partial [Tanacetum coccineum]
LTCVGVDDSVVGTEKEDPTLVVTKLLYLLKDKHFVVVGRGQSYHNLAPFVVEERGLKCH